MNEGILGYWEEFKATGFYENLGVEVPKELKEIAVHDLRDHGTSPYNGLFIPVTFEGEVLAQVNYIANYHAYRYVNNDMDMFSFERMWSHVSNFAAEFPEVLNEDQTEILEYKDRSVDLLTLDKNYLEEFYVECYKFWAAHPDLKAFYLAG